MLDIDKCKEILEHHFATVTPEEFLSNLEKFCPEFIAAGLDNSESIEIEKAAICQNLNADIPVERINPSQKFNSPRVPGQDKGYVIISPDFDDPLPADIIDDFYNSSIFSS